MQEKKIAGDDASAKAKKNGNLGVEEGENRTNHIREGDKGLSQETLRAGKLRPSSLERHEKSTMLRENGTAWGRGD